eukprot:CAMPEP_0197465472 /NCGR_PEP_ID=MMETSP1175-20131217/64554_1 /TAXON_ID=1003142 /ORGANISM="Triceratium dubium, Strain CCMP147" /LENGTH=615 /DNA_ID=CAMNT_0043001489 /DNA_START=217 /DNA_END=2066 /DNA_ORIENTATION=+
MSARVVNASDVAAREGDKDAPVSHGSLSKREERKHLVGGILALSRAMRNVARDAWLPGSNAGHIPTNAGQLEIYLTKQLGGKWTVEEKHTHGCTSAYFTAIQNDASANSSNNRLFVKLGKPSTSGRITNSALRNGTCEVDCFNRLWSQRQRRRDVERDCAAPVAGIRVPNCRIAESSKYGSKFVVVLDDLVGDNDEHKSDVLPLIIFSLGSSSQKTDPQQASSSELKKSARVVNASDVAAREGGKDSVSHGSLSKQEERKCLVGGMLALSRAMRNAARDAWLPGSKTSHIPTSTEQLRAYLTKRLGGPWTVEEKQTHGCTSAYFTAIQEGAPNAAASSKRRRLFVKLGKPSTSGRITNAALRNGTCEVECFNRLWSQRRRRGDVERDCAAPVAGMHVPNCRIAESSNQGTKGRCGGSREFRHRKRHQEIEEGRRLDPVRERGGSDRERDAALGGFCRLNDILDDLHPELRTLCHGDAHGGNIYFTGGNGDDNVEEVGLLDWQTYSYGNPIGDVASVLFNCLSKSDFIDHREDLMDAYIQALRRRGVEAYITRDMIVEGLYLKAGYYFSGLLFAFDLVGDDKHQQEMLLEGWKSFNEKAEILDLASNIEKFLHQYK